ncbi:MAG: RNA methyltransferase [Lachnospiraceae bacterium]|nr:RsmF rRNA methyltransferase first C-terminal domain-containing protein [uncultured Acetatifactor sp.]MCI8286370.1 RNA methyltransferase [Lachnospiraceae bacterium]
MIKGDAESGHGMLPEVFQQRMRRMLGEEYISFLEAFQRESHHGLRLNPLKTGLDGQSAAEKYGAAQGKDTGFAHLTPVSWAENGYYYPSSDQPGRHPLHEAGIYYIQEPSAMVPAELLDAKPGELILDLCAAPGGKSTQIAAKMRGSGFLLCNEIHSARAKILSENIERMGICNACVTNEPPEHLAESFPEYFDRILVDAPCSGEGMFRKKEEACGEWSQENVELCARRQDGILDCAARMLRPGGILVYSTCTFAPEENEGSVSRFLGRHREFSLLPVDKNRLGLTGADGVPEWVEEPMEGMENALRLWPQRISGEGHFAAIMKKAEAASGEICHGADCFEEERGTRNCPEEKYSMANCMKEGGGRPARSKAGARARRKEEKEKELQDLSLFCRENLKLSSFENIDSGVFFSPEENRSKEQEEKERQQNWDGVDIAEALGRAVGMKGKLQIIRFGDNLYLAPAEMPPLKRLKVLRPGLHLGELKKNRFEPSHALALALVPKAAAHRWEMKADSAEVMNYLKGQAFSAEGEKGWYLICVDDFGMGWGKLSGGMMKNHYPRGLRK